MMMMLLIMMTIIMMMIIMIMTREIVITNFLSIFFVGNRDANKLRLLVSLHPAVVALPRKVFWVPNK